MRGNRVDKCNVRLELDSVENFKLDTIIDTTRVRSIPNTKLQICINALMATAALSYLDEMWSDVQ